MVIYIAAGAAAARSDLIRRPVFFPFLLRHQCLAQVYEAINVVTAASERQQLVTPAAHLRLVICL